MGGREDTRKRPSSGEILHGDNLPLLQAMPSESAALIYIDPPFNTGKTQSRTRIKTAAVSPKANAKGNGAVGDRTGFGGRRYATTVVGSSGYADSFADYPGFLHPRLVEAHRILAPNGSLFFHIDWRESARCRLLLEEIFGGPAHCINEIIWAYDFGARSKKKWPAKHDNIYWFAKDPANYIFNFDAIDRIPYLAPDLVGEEKAENGKTPTDTWWQTIVPTTGREKTGYATQKPLRILERIVRAHSNPGDVVLDFFAGSGTTGVAARLNNRRYVLIDKSRKAVTIMRRRVSQATNTKPDEAKMASNQYMQLIHIAQNLKQQHRNSKRVWHNSPFEWLINMNSGAKGKVGKEMLKKFLRENGFLIKPRTGTRKGFDFSVNGLRVRVKFSTLWGENTYAFQQIRKESFDLLFCVGVSPHAVHVWLVEKSQIIWEEMAHQHGGSSGKDTWWIHCRPASSPHRWMRPRNGDLSKVCAELKKILKKLSA